MSNNKPSKPLIALNVPRKEIESGLIANTFSRLTTLSKSPESTRYFADSVMFSIDGYNSDPRELFEIPEVVAFIRKIDESWPLWFHFLEKKHGSIQALLMLLIGAKAVRRDDGRTNYMKCMGCPQRTLTQ